MVRQVVPKTVAAVRSGVPSLVERSKALTLAADNGKAVAGLHDFARAVGADIYCANSEDVREANRPKVARVAALPKGRQKQGTSPNACIHSQGKAWRRGRHSS